MNTVLTRPFTSVLVANRGEIAVRVINTAQALGLRTIAVYSEADAQALHTRLADQAVSIGPPPAAESYLNTHRIIEAARLSGAQALHPGYGFLSENADFARQCENAGLIFIGPGADAIELMGNKANAKRHMMAAGIACVPGYEGADQTDAAFSRAAAEIGFPVMVKAASGGGGRGMRLVGNDADLAAALSLARSESLSAFGSDELILEKALVRPRHVEVQVFADSFGNVVHLGERDCSVQRRHQKIVEEAPSPAVSGDLRSKMGATAVAVARNIGYRGAGTVEFLLAEDAGFYFLEMNTRLQVEHPVTEAITGLDLVALQIRVAAGEPLGIDQDDISYNGHAIEARLYAEDPTREFMPCTGVVDLWRPPTGPGVRVDAGLETGSEVTPYYDPMIAKIVASGNDRHVARLRLLRALRETALFGVKTNRDFLLQILENESFADGSATTALIDDGIEVRVASPPPECLEHAVAAAALQYRAASESALAAAVNVAAAQLNWGSAGRLETVFRYSREDADVDVTVSPCGTAAYDVDTGTRRYSIEITSASGSSAAITIDGRSVRAIYCIPDATKIHLSIEGRNETFVSSSVSGTREQVAVGAGRVSAPMHGLLVDVFAAAGDSVGRGQRLAVLEAMKMQHEIVADVAGVIADVRFAAGEQIAAEDLIFMIEPEATDEE